jgi:cell wall-associated NlpC family hydrolase
VPVRTTPQQAPRTTAPAAPAAPIAAQPAPAPAAAPTAQAAPAVQPSKIAQPSAQSGGEDVITLDLRGKARQKAAVGKRDQALRNRAASLGRTEPAPDTAPAVEEPKISREEALDRRRMSLARTALGFRGTPYVWGGDSPRAFDCSGFTQYLYKKQYGISLPHNAKMQYGMGRAVSSDDLQVGDLVFFNTRGPLTHVGMYIGDDRFVHAANPRRGVRVDNLAGYYMKVFAGARRYR